MEQLLISLVLIIVLYFLWIKYKPETALQTPVTKENFAEKKNEGKAWDEVIKDFALDPEIIASQKNYANQKQIYSTGPSFTMVADDNTSPYFTNFVGFYRPEYVPVGETARSIPDVDTEVLKRNFNPLHVPYD